MALHQLLGPDGVDVPAPEPRAHIPAGFGEVPHNARYRGLSRLSAVAGTAYLLYPCPPPRQICRIENSGPNASTASLLDAALSRSMWVNNRSWSADDR